MRGAGRGHSGGLRRSVLLRPLHGGEPRGADRGEAAGAGLPPGVARPGQAEGEGQEAEGGPAAGAQVRCRRRQAFHRDDGRLERRRGGASRVCRVSGGAVTSRGGRGGEGDIGPIPAHRLLAEPVPERVPTPTGTVPLTVSVSAPLRGRASVGNCLQNSLLLPLLLSLKDVRYYKTTCA